jgi:c-di-GMP-related signal transduction protein
MKPIISNLIGIMQDQPQLSKAAVRLGLKALFHHISEYVAEKRDEISEEDAHIRGLFSTLQKALQDNIDRAEAGVNVIKDIFNFLHAKVGSLESFTAGSETVTKAAEHILEEKGHLCQEFQQHASHAKIAYSKVEHIVSQLQEVLAVDGANLESFLQKNMKVMKKN